MYQICVSGAAKGETVEESKHLAAELGEAIAKAGHYLMTGATVGLPNYAAEAYKKAGGKMSIGISPADSKVEHVMKYRLPVKAYDAIVYSGLHYVGRDLLLINTSDAVLSIGGRLGTLYEATISIETETPIGFFLGSGGVSDIVEDIIQLGKPLRDEAYITYNQSATDLVKDITKHLDKINAKYKNIYH